MMSHLWVVAGPLQLPQREVFWGFSPASPPRFHRSHQCQGHEAPGGCPRRGRSCGDAGKGHLGCSQPLVEAKGFDFAPILGCFVPRRSWTPAHFAPPGLFTRDFFHFFFLPGVGSRNYSGPGPGVTQGLAQAPPKSLSHAALPGAAAVPSLQGAAGEGGAGEGAREGFLPGWALSEPGSKPFFFWLRERPGAEVPPRTPKFASGDELGGTRSCWVLGPQMKHPGRNGRRSFHQPRVCTRTLLVPARGAAGEVDVLNALPCPPQPPRRGSTSSLAACHFSADV